MLVRGRHRLRLAGRTFDREQLVLENCTGRVQDCRFINGRTRLSSTSVKVARRSIYTQLDGGGVLIVGNTDLTFHNCKFANNQSAMCGGAVSLQCKPGSKVIFDRCVFEGNAADDTGPAIDLLTSGMRVEIRDCIFRSNRTTGKWTSKPIGQITVFPGNQLSLERSKFSGHEIDVDYHETNRKVDIATDKIYQIVDTSKQRNGKKSVKLLANIRAYFAHPLHYPWL